MIPKRKFIKKQYIAPKNKESPTETFYDFQDLTTHLHSLDQKIKTDAIAAIANLPQIPSEIVDPTCLHTLINLVSPQSNPSTVHITLYALINIFELHPQTTIKACFENGLEKCLMEIWNSNLQQSVIKPVLILMRTLCVSGELFNKYNEMIQGFSKAVFNIQNISNNEICEPLLELLILSDFVITEEQLAKKNQQISAIAKMAELDKSYKKRGLASRFLCLLSKGNSASYLSLFQMTLDEFLHDIQLEKQFYNNIAQNINPSEQTPLHENNQQIAQEDMKMSGKQRKLNFNENAYNLLLDSLQGLQIMLQFCVNLVSNNQEFEDVDDDEEIQQQQQMMEEQNEGPPTINQQALLKIIYGCLIKNKDCLYKFSILTFVEGQCIIQLMFKLLHDLPEHVLAQITTKDALIELTEQSIVNLSKMYAKIPLNQNFYQDKQIPPQIFYFNLDLLFSLILKYKQINSQGIYVELPGLRFHNSDQLILPVQQQCRECWLHLLEIYSSFYNPEKNGAITIDGNRILGQILKHLLISIPEMEMEQWRGQCIDTVFDVYSNEKFDQIFVELGFPSLLESILSKMTGRPKQKKRGKFINAVMKDLERFIAYKKKMIKF